MENEEFLLKSVKHNDIKTVKELLQSTDFSNSTTAEWCFIIASNKGYLEIIKLLLKDGRICPTINNNNAIGLAALNNYIEIVELLLSDPRVNPADRQCWAIKNAVRRGHSDVVDLLWNSKKVKLALQSDNIGLYNKLLKDELLLKISGFN